ncbi:MAG: hypothetical protein ABI947_10690 [Chloroflexota bacterium]
MTGSQRRRRRIAVSSEGWSSEFPMPDRASPVPTAMRVSQGQCLRCPPPVSESVKVAAQNAYPGE